MLQVRVLYFKKKHVLRYFKDNVLNVFTEILINKHFFSTHFHLACYTVEVA